MTALQKTTYLCHLPQSAPQPWCKRMQSSRTSPRACKGLTERSPPQHPCKCLVVAQLLRDSGILLPTCAQQQASLAPRAPHHTCLGTCACIDPTATTVHQNYQVSSSQFCPLWQLAITGTPHAEHPASSCGRPLHSGTGYRGRPLPCWAPASQLHQQLGHDMAAPASTQLPRPPFVQLHAS